MLKNVPVFCLNPHVMQEREINAITRRFCGTHSEVMTSSLILEGLEEK